MADAVEVAIESALLDRLNALVLSPPVVVMQPNVLPAVIPPATTTVGGVTVYGCYLRPTYLPATSVELAVGFDDANQHYGLFQVDVFYGEGAGELKPARIAASVIEWFKRGTLLFKDGFRVQITRPPYRMQARTDEPWVMIPVRIPYLAYADSPI